MIDEIFKIELWDHFRTGICSPQQIKTDLIGKTFFELSSAGEPKL